VENQGLSVIDMCSTESTSLPKAIIQSPSYPTYKTNLKCPFTLNLPDEPNKVVNVYSIHMNIVNYKILNQGGKT
jgi:hypothetical protein